MLTATELKQVRTYVVKILPELLRADPAVATTIEGILAELFPRRDELARMLDELERNREETKLGFAKADEFQTKTTEFIVQSTEFQTNTTEFIVQSTEFQTNTTEFIAQSIEFQSEAREKFAQIENFQTKTTEFIEQSTEFQSEARGKFAQIDEFQVEVREKFNQVDQRFNQVDKTLLGVRRDIVQLKSGQESLSKQMKGMQAWVNLVVGNLGVNKGQSLEGLVAAALRHGLNNPDIKAKQIRLNQSLIDVNGDVFLPGYKSEVDLIATNGKLTVFEVKATGKASDVGFFALKLKLLQKQNPDITVKGVFITLTPTAEIQEQCDQYAIELAS